VNMMNTSELDDIPLKRHESTFRGGIDEENGTWTPEGFDIRNSDASLAACLMSDPNADELSTILSLIPSNGEFIIRTSKVLGIISKLFGSKSASVGGCVRSRS
jgi:hypothetical protein